MKVAGKMFWLWRAVDQNGFVLEDVLQHWRDARAAKRLLNTTLKKFGRPPRRIVTNKLRSYGAAKRKIVPGLEQQRGLALELRRERAGKFRKGALAEADLQLDGDLLAPSFRAGAPT